MFVCQYDNLRTIKHRMMKLGGRCTLQKSRPNSNVGVSPHGAPPKCGVDGLRRWNISADYLSSCSLSAQTYYYLRQGGYVFDSVCLLLVCPSTSFHDFLELVAPGTTSTRLYFGVVTMQKYLFSHLLTFSKMALPVDAR